MADRIRAIGRLQASPSGTFRQLGGKRTATVLWKAVVKGDSTGVNRTLEKSDSRHQAHDAVATAKVVLTIEGNFTNDLDGLSRLLDRTHPDPAPTLDDPVRSPSLSPGALRCRLERRDRQREARHPFDDTRRRQDQGQPALLCRRGRLEQHQRDHPRAPWYEPIAPRDVANRPSGPCERSHKA